MLTTDYKEALEVDDGEGFVSSRVMKQSSSEVLPGDDNRPHNDGYQPCILLYWLDALPASRPASQSASLYRVDGKRCKLRFACHVVLLRRR